MQTYRTVDRDTILDMAAFLVRDIDRMAEYAARVSNLPKMAANYEGQIAGMRTALAIMAGTLEYGTTDALIHDVRLARPTIAGNGRRQTVHDAEGARDPNLAGQVANVLMTDARQSWPVDHEEGEA